jgi:hypothetical protein
MLKVNNKLCERHLELKEKIRGLKEELRPLEEEVALIKEAVIETGDGETSRFTYKVTDHESKTVPMAAVLNFTGLSEEKAIKAGIVKVTPWKQIHIAPKS